MPQLRIVFDGVIAIGPRHPEGLSPKRSGPLFAVMPRSTRQRNRWSTNEKSRPQSYIPVHFPVIFTRTKPNHGPGLRPADEFVNGEWYVWYPVRERMTFAFDGNIAPGDLIYTRSPGKNGDIGQLSDMTEIWPSRSKLRRGMKSQRPSARVAGQVFVPSGTISTDTDNPKKRAEVVFQPKKTKNECRKVIVPQLVVTNEVNRVEIAMQSLDTGDDLDPISFDIATDSEITIGNADPADVRAVLHHLPVSPPEGSSLYDNDESRTPSRGWFDADFELYYTILAGKDSKEMPVPVNTQKLMLGIRNCYTLLVEK